MEGEESIGKLTTSLGHPGDFHVELSKRVMVNGVFWALGKPVPAAEVRIAPLPMSKDGKAKTKSKKAKKDQ